MFWEGGAREGPPYSDRMQENNGGTAVGEQGKKDKGKREQQKKAKLSSKEKRQLKREKKK